ncbi:flagellar protein FlgN [[Clostridium] polysaccharolyticum]|uniref:FlgN protein n=1 Tax=[Clostridium] polysaccharolyticum TaxID=29364 RepID=A0A1I0CVI6_9FIRM|nr:flagellar protein FlgN [[Clostridium] polysaccharolyticum]SET23136.1 FlgN protein [[Clostridium] polysaccharolyticum]
MASLIEELIQTLEKEEKVYEELLPVVEKKAQIIIKNDLEELQRVTAAEQDYVDLITSLEHNRNKIISNIGIVMNRKPEELNLKAIVAMLEKQPAEQEKLGRLHDSLIKKLGRLKDLNMQNKILIEQSLEMIEFSMNVIQSDRIAPVNNYNRAAATQNIPMSQRGMFDAKQ